MYRLAPGHHVYRTDSGWRYANADSEIVRVTTTDDLMERLTPYLATDTQAHRLDPDMIDADVTDEDVVELAEALVARGVLVSVDRHEKQGPTGGRGGDLHGHRLGHVLVVGDGAIADCVASLLDGPCRLTRLPRPTEQAVADVDAVVSVEGWLPDARWLQEDELMTTAGVVWQRCYREGVRVVIGPVMRGTAGPTYADTRGRLLAAAPDPTEMLALWQHLAATAPPDELTPDVAHVAAGLLVADLHLAARTLPRSTTSGPATVRVGVQRVLDPNGWALTSHPVLPLPRTDGTRG